MIGFQISPKMDLQPISADLPGA
jgi:hypothetical protein